MHDFDSPDEAIQMLADEDSGFEVESRCVRPGV
jgi:hypothetical protein